MKRHLLFFFFISLSFVALAQTQQGYVKTKGRMVNGKLVPGQGLKGTVISVQGRSAVLVNKDNGSFSFPVTSDQFRLDSVKKKGYQLVDMEACPRTYKYSSNPLYIVMETPDQQLQDQLTAERKIRRNLQKQLQDKEDEIENLKAQQKISVEEYHTALQKLYQEQENNEQLIKDMAKRYSELDYDQLDEFYRQVSYCIENGELVKADSLLKTRGDITAQVADIKQRGQALQDERSQLEKAEAVQQADIEEAARRCYSYFETFKAQHLNDTAAYFIELRASLDTTNVDWQKDAGYYVEEFIADYDKALNYYQLGLRQSQLQFGENHGKTAMFYGDIGSVFGEIGDYEKAIEYNSNALVIRKTVFGENHVDVALSYNNMGSVFAYQELYDKAFEYHSKALNIRKRILGENATGVALCYNNIGFDYFGQSNYDKALEYFNKALFVYMAISEDNSPEMADVYNNIGGVYDYQGNDDKALEHYCLALNIRKSIFGKNHPRTASSYHNLGSVYTMKKDYDKALEYNSLALAIRKHCFGEKHLDVADSYLSFGDVYMDMGDYEKALEFYFKALPIREELLGKEHPKVADIYNDIGATYYFLEKGEKALEYQTKALVIRKIVLEENHPKIAICYNNIGNDYCCLGNYDKALENHDKALAIWKLAYGENHPDVARSYYNIGNVYRNQVDYEKALEYYQKALIIWEETLGLDHQNTQMVKDKISEVKAKIFFIFVGVKSNNDAYETSFTHRFYILHSPPCFRPDPARFRKDQRPHGQWPTRPGKGTEKRHRLCAWTYRRLGERRRRCLLFPVSGTPVPTGFRQKKRLPTGGYGCLSQVVCPFRQPAVRRHGDA